MQYAPAILMPENRLTDSGQSCSFRKQYRGFLFLPFTERACLVTPVSSIVALSAKGISKFYPYKIRGSLCTGLDAFSSTRALSLLFSLKRHGNTSFRVCPPLCPRRISGQRLATSQSCPICAQWPAMICMFSLLFSSLRSLGSFCASAKLVTVLTKVFQMRFHVNDPIFSFGSSEVRLILYF